LSYGGAAALADYPIIYGSTRTIWGNSHMMKMPKKITATNGQVEL
jgi:hypothetical protein